MVALHSEAEPLVDPLLFLEAITAVSNGHNPRYSDNDSLRAEKSVEDVNNMPFLSDTEQLATLLLNSETPGQSAPEASPSSTTTTTKTPQQRQRTPASPRKKRRPNPQPRLSIPRCRDIWMDGPPENADEYELTKLRQVVQLPNYSQYGHRVFTNYATMPSAIRPVEQSIVVRRMQLNVSALKDVLVGVSSSLEDVSFKGCPNCLRSEEVLLRSGHFDSCSFFNDAPIEKVHWYESTMGLKELEKCVEYHELKEKAKSQCKQLMKVDVPFSYIDGSKKRRTCKVTCCGDILDGLLGLDELGLSQDDFWKLLNPSDDDTKKELPERYFIWLVHRMSMSDVKMWILVHDLAAHLLPDGFYGTEVSIEEPACEALKMERHYRGHKAGELFTYFLGTA